MLVDFWTYSCINCLRTLPHLKAWDAAYRDAGLTIVGVHSPEFAFERVPDNVRSAVRRLGVGVSGRARQRLRDLACVLEPVLAGEVPDRPGRPHPLPPLRRGRLRGYGATDPPTARRNGEGATDVGRRGAVDRGQDSRVVPRLRAPRALRQRQRGARRGVAVHAPARSLGARRPCVWRPLEGRGRAHRCRTQRRLRLRFQARDVFLVLEGEGDVEVRVDGRPVRTVHVSGLPRLYTLARFPRFTRGLLELRFSPGVAGYAFTFG